MKKRDVRLTYLSKTGRKTTASFDSYEIIYPFHIGIFVKTVRGREIHFFVKPSRILQVSYPKKGNDAEDGPECDDGPTPPSFPPSFHPEHPEPVPELGRASPEVL